jgi:hypothetical protein
MAQQQQQVQQQQVQDAERAKWQQRELAILADVEHMPLELAEKLLRDLTAAIETRRHS